MRLRPFSGTTNTDRSKERYRRVAVTSVAALGSKVIGVSVSLVTVPLTFAYLGDERYGLWMAITAATAKGFARGAKALFSVIFGYRFNFG